jgi:hypothetical protein
MKPTFSLEECLKRYLSQLRVQLQLEVSSPPIAESRKEWEADIKTQEADIRCVQYWLERIQSGESI